MRTCFAFLLAVLLSLNVASAAVVGVCDALEHMQGHTAHFGHHSHEHNDDHDCDAPPADPNGTGKAPAGSSHHHHVHVHPGFSTLLSGAVCVMTLDGHSRYASLDRRDFVSAPHLRLDRPPRTALA